MKETLTEKIVWAALPPLEWLDNHRTVVGFCLCVAAFYGASRISKGADEYSAYTHNLQDKVAVVADANHDGLSNQEMLAVYTELGIKYDLNKGLPPLTVPQMETYLRKHNITLDDKMK
jgi:hypothetical protein